MSNLGGLVTFILALPLFGALFQSLLGHEFIALLGRRNGKRALGLIAFAVVAASFAAAVLLAMQLDTAGSGTFTTELGRWISLQSVSFPFSVRVDHLSIVMMLVITGVGALIHLYAASYMFEDRDYNRFFAYMNLFVAAMLLLVLANNLVLLFVGWEGVGLCSYLLIGFWYEDENNVKAANKAFIVNRIGDWGFMLGTFLLICFMLANVGPQVAWAKLNILDMGNVNQVAAAFLSHKPALAFFIAILLFVGCAGKSAQFPLYFWLPDAMAGPTPVSALIHAATMVTSGVYLMNRLSFVFAASASASCVIVMIGAFTAIWAALIAFGQTDIKKVLAYSTVSQLGFMFIACGAGAYSAGLFHVVTHAFFKALLFLGAGAVIYAMAHNQDMRAYGKLAKYLPVTFATMLVAYLAISGFPLLSGFFSKEAILTGAFTSGLAQNAGTNYGQISGGLGLFAAILTAIYMSRLMMLTFMGNKEQWREMPAVEGHGHGHGANEALAAYVPSVKLPNHDAHNFYYTEHEVARYKALHRAGGHEELTPDHNPKEVPLFMWVPLVLLAVAAAVSGFLLNGKIQDYLAPVLDTQVKFSADPTWLKPAGIGAALLGLAVGIGLYWKGLPDSEGFDLSKWNPVRKWAGMQFGYDRVMSDGVSEASRDVSILGVLADRGIEAILSLLAIAASAIGLLCRKVQTGSVRIYASIMFIGVVILLGYFLIQSQGVIH